MTSTQDQERILRIKEAVAALKAETTQGEPTAAQLHSRLSSAFGEERDMLRFIGANWRELPEALPIADNGPGFYLSPFGLVRADKSEPVPHNVSEPHDIPPCDETRSTHVKWQGTLNFVIVVASRLVGVRIFDDLQAVIAGQRGPVPSVRGQPWWMGIIIVTGSKPTTDDEIFFKVNCIAAGPVPCLVYANGDTDGFAAARKLLAGSTEGPPVLHAEWQAQTYRDLLRSRALGDIFSALYGPSDSDSEADDLFQARKIVDESAHVKAELDRWCNMESWPAAPRIGGAAGEMEKETLEPIAQTARELREAGVFYPLVAFQTFLLQRVEWYVKGFFGAS